MSVYNSQIGYSRDNVNLSALEDKLYNVKNLILKHLDQSIIDNILVAGCGTGEEVKIFSNLFGAKIIGIDLFLPNSCQSMNSFLSENSIFVKGNVTHLPLKDNFFNLIYCYHVLEHVDNPEKTLIEFHRVIKNEGIIFIGFPNRNRLTPSYFNSHLNLSLFQIILFNLIDYKKKLSGKFRNQSGAHAGFSEKEFIALSSNIFKTIIPLRYEYTGTLYPKYLNIINLLRKLKIDDLFYPSNYYILKKT